MYEKQERTQVKVSSEKPKIVKKLLNNNSMVDVSSVFNYKKRLFFIIWVGKKLNLLPVNLLIKDN